MRHSALLAGVMCAALALLYVGPALIPGHVFVPLDLPRDFEAWKSGPGERVRVSNRMLSDVVVQFTVWDEEVRRLLRRGEMPWVNVYAGDGGPLFANPQTALFSPFTWPRLLFGLPGWAIASLMKLIAATLSMYWLARVLGATPIEAMLSGAVFAMSGFTILWLLSPHTNVFVVLPALAAAVLQRRRGAVFLFAALATAGGHPETLFVGVVGIAALVLWERRAELRTTLSALAGFLLLGVVLVPFALLLFSSYARIARPRLPEPGFRFAALAGEILPGFLGAPLKSELDLTGMLPIPEPLQFRSAAYIGFVTLIAIALAWRKLAPSMRRGVIIGLIAFAISLRPPIVRDVLRHVPLLGWTAMQYFALVFVVFAAAAAGPALLRLASQHRRTGVVLLFAGGLLIAGGSFAASRPIAERAARAGIAHLRERGFLRQPPETYERRLAGYLEAGRWTAVRRIALPGLCWLVAGLGLLLRRSQLVVAGVAGELLLFGVGWNPAIRTEEIAPAPAVVQEVRRLDPTGRWLFGAHFEVFPANLGTRYQLRDVVSYDVLTSAERVAQLLPAGYDPLLHTLPLDPTPEQERTLAGLGVRYSLTPAIRELPGAVEAPRPRNVPPAGLLYGILCSAVGAILPLLPSRVRRFIRTALREVPLRVIDAPADLRDRFVGGPSALPPPSMRGGVGIDSSRRQFLTVGAAAADQFQRLASGQKWLDFGCGSGRVARHMNVDLTGVDVDDRAIQWCREHLRGSFLTIAPRPPLPFEDGSFDVIDSVSVFTHFDEAAQFAWLAEMRRVLRPGGVFIATTHAPDLTYNRPDLTTAHHQELATKGFTFITGDGAFNDDSAFHSAAYLAREWSRFFTLVEHKPMGLCGYQDISVWQR